MNDFYVVWNPEAGPPTYRHVSLGAATAEAERLARTNPGQKFFVLGTIGFAEQVPPPSIFTKSKWNIEDPEIPF